MNGCTGRRDITEILLKTALSTIESINQSPFPTFLPLKKIRFSVTFTLSSANVYNLDKFK